MRENRLRDLQLAYVGRTMAGVSHDFKNHLAIIRELNGLLEDLLMAEDSVQQPNYERYKKIFSGIDERVVQASKMCRFLSGFSHRMDQPLSSFNANDVLQEAIYLLQRFARQQQVDLEFSFEEDLPVIFNNPSLLQFAFFCIVRPALEQMEKESRILIATSRQDSTVKMMARFEGMKTKPEENDISPLQEFLPEVLQRLQAELSVQPQRNEYEEVVLTLKSINYSPSQT